MSPTLIPQGKTMCGLCSRLRRRILYVFAITYLSRTPTVLSPTLIPQGKTMCGLCSRLRRRILYVFAKRNGFTKIALGHHRDDIVETLFLNMFYGGKLKSMPPKLLSDDEEILLSGHLPIVKKKILSNTQSYGSSLSFHVRYVDRRIICSER